MTMIIDSEVVINLISIANITILCFYCGFYVQTCTLQVQLLGFDCDRLLIQTRNHNILTTSIALIIIYYFDYGLNTNAAMEYGIFIVINIWPYIELIKGQLADANQ